jgi:brefeldin A-inhibited guanine nucleotide-exchange protein
VVALVSKCGESHSEAVQLAVIRALLTITTAEHFVVHGDSLMQAVRTVFNVAIGSESVEIQRTARSALLQMLNTIVKRVTSYSLVSLCTASSRHSEAFLH